MKNLFHQHIFIFMLSFDDFWSSNLKHNSLEKSSEINLINQVAFFLADSFFFIFERLALIWLFDLFNCIEVDSVAIDQGFQSRECFCFRHRVDRIVVFVDSSDFDYFTSFVWLTKVHDVDHQSFFVRCF